MAYITGQTVKTLREKKGLTQRALAEKIGVSDKAVSKWETEKGLPDISLLPLLADALGVSVAELLTGEVAVNRNRSAQLKRSRFYVCPVCGNMIYALGEGAFSCCGVRLQPAEVEANDEAHRLTVEPIEDELYVHTDHPMEKGHYISFVAYVTDKGLQLCKWYPEQAAETRFKRTGDGLLYTYCNRHGLFLIDSAKRKT